MVAPKRKGTIEIGEDLVFQRREWMFERVGWAAMLLVLLAALLGLLGNGPLGTTSAHTPDGTVHVEYDRFLRRHAETDLRVRVESDSPNEVRVWLSSEYLHALQVVEVSPLPVRVESGHDRHVYVFPLNESSRSLLVRFRVNPDCQGRLTGRVGVGDNSVEVSHLVYP
jgi:hypothetical protein